MKNRDNKGFTLVELLVALGLAIVILVSIAQVFGISTKVVRSSLLQSSYYTKLAAAHCWMADTISFEELKSAGNSEDFATFWSITGTENDANGAGDIVKSGSDDYHGLLFTPAKTMSANEFASPGGSNQVHNGYVFTFGFFYANSKSEIVPDGPEKTLICSLKMYFAGNQ